MISRRQFLKISTGSVGVPLIARQLLCLALLQVVREGRATV